jgi:hypothetical protein
MENKMKFSRLNINSKLVKNLKDKTWWKMIVKLVNTDKNFNIQIRPNSINVYYKMANFLKIINDNPVAEIHYKFIPTKSDKDYVRINFDKNLANLKSTIDIVTDNILSIENIEKIKKIIEKYNSKGEKGYQSDLIKDNYDVILDAEIASKKYGRIDLMIYNEAKDEIIAVEFKVITDSRLFNHEIYEQLERYKNFMNHKDIIRKAYLDTIKTKLYLGLIQEGSPLLKINDNTKIVDYPILAITSHNQLLITNFKDAIKTKIKSIAYSLNMFGTTGSLLNFKGNNELLKGNYEN